ncbi:MAG: DedA family protein [Rickettsiales bacterium]|nr:DedA family protein [Rickettsiales bacterium]
MELIHHIIELLVHYINQVGYIGIFIGMFLESTLVPIPSELIMIPAGIAVSLNTMSMPLVLLFGITGNVAGAGFSYIMSQKIGRPIILKIGKYFFVKESAIIKIENYFKNHGPISVFTGRLLIGFRHFISIPAGLANMNLKKFYLYTTAGSTIWTTILTILGYFIGKNQQLLEEYLKEITLIMLIVILISIPIYIILKKRYK